VDEGSEPVGVWRCKGDVQMSVWPSPGPLLHVKPFAAGAAALWRSHGPGRLLVKLQARSLLLDYPVPAERFFAPSLALSCSLPNADMYTAITFLATQHPGTQPPGADWNECLVEA